MASMGDWQAIEVKAKMLQARIDALVQERRDLLRTDEDYAEYLDIWRESGRVGRQLSLRNFHELDDEYDRLHREWEESGYSEVYWKKHADRMAELEKLLLCA